MKTTPIQQLKKRLLEISHLASVSQLLGWDQEVNMPSKAADSRAASGAELSGILHARVLALDEGGLLSKLKKAADAGKIKGADAVIIFETWRSFDRERKLPEQFVREMSETCSKAQNVWITARKNSDFKMFLPWLAKVVELKKREAKYVGYKDSPYDALIDQYEPGMTATEAGKILNDLKEFLVPFLADITKAKKKNSALNKNGKNSQLALLTKLDKNILKGKFDIEKQKSFNKLILKKIGFDFEAGRLDVATHPFAVGLHPYDVRITSRYSETDVMYSVGSTIHEAGHGLYEQGLPAEHFGTPLCESVSLGIHESQSRLWENLIGKSLPFWKHTYPLLQKEFPVPFKNVSLEDFYRVINSVGHSLIRTESDEVTYNLHIILRFEIEKAMIEGTLELKDLPKIWNAKMKKYFGIDVPNDAQGVLQDVHWSMGGIGYFPTYTFGNLYSAQIFAEMKRDMSGLEKLMAKGEFTSIREWLRKHIHTTGKTHTAEALVKKVTGEPLNSRYFVEYLKGKYSKLYKM